MANRKYTYFLYTCTCIDKYVHTQTNVHAYAEAANGK